MEITAETFMTSKQPIAATTKHKTEFNENELPDIFPSKYTISMPQENIYQLRDMYREYNFISIVFFRSIQLHSS